MSFVSGTFTTWFSAAPTAATAVPSPEQSKIVTFFKERIPTPFPQKSFEGTCEFLEITGRFFDLNWECEDGASFLEDVRKYIPRSLKNRGETWTQLHYRGHSAIYHVIVRQKLKLIEGLLTSPEGRECINQNYMRPSYLPMQTEYPIHTAVKMACSFRFYESKKRWNAEQIVLKLIEWNADPTQEDSTAKTPLYIALVAGKLSLVQLLIQHQGFAVKMDCPRAPLNKWHIHTLYRHYETVLSENLKIIEGAASLPQVIARVIVDYLF
jgi:hypothetical protein